MTGQHVGNLAQSFEVERGGPPDVVDFSDAWWQTFGKHPGASAKQVQAQGGIGIDVKPLQIVVKPAGIAAPVHRQWPGAAA